MTREPANRRWRDGQWAERWIEHRPGWAALCYRNGDTERAIWRESIRSGPFALLRVRLWAARRFTGLPVRRVRVV